MAKEFLFDKEENMRIYNIKTVLKLFAKHELYAKKVI